MQLTSPIHFKDICLKSLTAEHANPRYLRWMQDPQVNKYLEIRFSELDIPSLKSFIEDNNRSTNNLLLGIFVDGGAEHIGNIKLGPIIMEHQQAILGLLIGEPAHWGKGYATQAIQAISEYAFQNMKLERLYAGCYASNQGSVKAFLKAGYQQEALLRGHWTVDGRREDGIQMGLLKSDLSAARTR